MAKPPPDDRAVEAPVAGGRILGAALLGWLGALISWLLLQQDPGVLGLICHSRAGCEAALSSQFSVVLGIPLAWFGVGFYLTIFALLLIAFGAASPVLRRCVLSFTGWLCVAGLTFSVLLMYVQFVVLRAFCPLCTASAVVMAALVAILAKTEGAGSPGSPVAALALAGMAVLSGVVLATGKLGARDEVVALVDAQEWTRGQMETELAARLYPLEEERYGAEFGWVRSKVDAALLAAEARRVGIAPEALLAERMGPEPAIGSTEIEAQLAKTGRPLSAANVETARQELLGEWREQAKIGVLGEIAKAHRVEVFLKAPVRRVLQIDLATAQISGPRDAPVQLVVFSDFQCQFCARLAPVLRRIRADFPDQVLVAFRYFPLEAHPRAMPSAIAAECAAEQGKFWEYHDQLFAEGGDLGDARLLVLAAGLGLDEGRFRECLRGGRARQVVEASFQDAVKSGLEGAPAVFLNGTRVLGGLDYDALAGQIRAQLRVRSGAHE